MVHIQANTQLASLEELVSDALVQLVERGFAEQSVNYYKYVWDSFA